MKNSKLRRALLLLASAVLLVSLSVGATLAYLSSTDSVKNTFTVGQVNITLDEGEVYPAGEQAEDGTYIGGTHTDDGETRVDENHYKVYPGMDYDKDPTVHVKAGSEDCYVGVHIHVDNFDALHEVLPADIEGHRFIGFEGIVTGGVFDYTPNTTTEEYVGPTATGYYRVFMTDENGNDVVLYQNGNGDFYVIYDYKQVTLNATVNKDLILFEQIKVPADWNNTELAALDNLNMTITAYAVQAEGFKDSKDALTTAFVDAAGNAVFGFLNDF